MAKKILITDDSAFMRLTLRDILAGGGYDVAGEAGSGAEAFKKAEQLAPDLITMDVVMEGGGGIEAVKAIISRNPRANILMVSAIGQQELMMEAIKAGARGFIIKPFDTEKVLAEVKRIIG